jgi:5-oxoprolinase (ATP-hydrolysing)
MRQMSPFIWVSRRSTGGPTRFANVDLRRSRRLLGAMSFAVVFQLRRLGPSLRPGDVILANSPVAGGSHLPDLTVITPVFSVVEPGSNEEPKIIFFTASRGHHADIGGAQPGSMPSYSTSLSQEGAEIISFKMVDGGKYDRDGLYKLLVEDPAKTPGCSGCRDFRSVESDLKAVSARAGMPLNWGPG